MKEGRKTMKGKTETKIIHKIIKIPKTIAKTLIQKHFGTDERI